MKLKLKGKKFFKEVKTLFKENSNSVSPELDEDENVFCEGPSHESGRRRKVGKSSYRKTHFMLNKPKNDAAQCYKVLGLKTIPNSNKVKLIDTLNGKVYNTNIPNLTKNAYAYDTLREALSERLPSRVVGSRTSERLCRVLVSFECWGETHRRLGGGNGCSEYEFLKFVRIERSLDSPAKHSVKSATLPTPPHHFPPPDKIYATRNLPTSSSVGKGRGGKRSRGAAMRSSTAPTNPTFRTALMTKEVRLKVVFSKDMLIE